MVAGKDDLGQGRVKQALLRATLGCACGVLSATAFEVVRVEPPRVVAECTWKDGGNRVRLDSGAWFPLREIWPDSEDVACSEGIVGETVEKPRFALGYRFAGLPRGPSTRLELRIAGVGVLSALVASLLGLARQRRIRGSAPSR